MFLHIKVTREHHIDVDHERITTTTTVAEVIRMLTLVLLLRQKIYKIYKKKIQL